MERRQATALDSEIEATRTELRILEESLAHLREVAEDAEIRAFMAETPLSYEEDRRAREALQRATRRRDEVLAELISLLGERDRLPAGAAGRTH